ncbi:hypothetical protein LAJ19_10900 [Deinococcus taeanensis]|uniref:hypothetical protein n=1 Tax=Deinococcus taeanensis TaxID=2737050 RepID=UPI001CDD2896|nr:hypothetical protein [Deinococcus taeanensis]UBV42136.1 hypothetical protein LAJ19_10900 [Deinococcus taeanensis]
MTWPEDTLHLPSAPATRRPPSVALGHLLNLLLPGSGFSYIGLIGWHVGWIGILIVLNLLASVVAGLTGSSGALLLPVAGVGALLVHFGRAYAQREARSFRPDPDNSVKIALIAGHAVLHLFLVGILAAVLIPNLLGARTRATQAGEQAAARMAYTFALAEQAGGTLRDGPCPLADVPDSSRDQISTCTVSQAASTSPQVEVTFRSGRTLQLP